MATKRKQKSLQAPERVKTRKELRKEKRNQKKANRVHFHQKKKELKLAYRARLKEHQTKQKNGTKMAKKQPDDNKQFVDSRMKEESIKDDDEILSDFELSDEELEAKFSGKGNKKKPSIPISQLQQDRQREKQQQKKLEKEMLKQRVRQLKVANEDEEKEIRRLEKQLKLDKKHKSDKKVPKMFNDGLDYALELCLPENVQKMYEAAKEAADCEDSDGFEEDLNIVMGKQIKNKSKRKGERVPDGGALEKKSKFDLKMLRQMTKLREIESKYFDSDNELISDMSEIDSEFDVESEHGEERSRKEFDGTETESEEDESDDDSENIDEDSDDNDDVTEDELHQRIETVSDNSVGRFVRAPQQPINTAGLDDDPALDDEDMTHTNPNDLRPNEWEDIYGRRRNEDGDIVETTNNESKYIPPHLRAKTIDENGADTKRQHEKLQRLRKQLKGHLNRLSEANMHKISSTIENLYMQNSRYDMNNTLTSLILEGLVSNVLAPERMVLEHTLLIAALHANVGSEIGAHILQTCITKLDDLMQQINDLNVEDKQLDNVLFIICHMYTFKIFQHTLIYEILNHLAQELSEKSIECILLTLRSIGFSLRKDDPIALKDLISNIQRKSNEASADLKNNSRCKYMLDVLLAIKNNNVNKIPQYDPTLAEHLRKILKSLLVNGKYVTTLNITLDDLLKADQRGKWWVVGSAWSGNIKDIGNATSTANNSKPTVQRFSDHLLELAKKQRMNTDDRRNVFCILMSAEDYVESFEKLLQLNIKDQKVIVTVTIHCCLSEKIFNPYYGVLIQKFCDYDRKYQLAVQFAIWDRIKDIKSHSTIQIRNLAQFLLHLFENGGLPLSILKIIQFGELDKVTLRLVRQIMLGLLLGKEDTCKQVFERIAPSAKLKVFKDSLRLFMHHFLVQGAMKSGISDEQIDLLKKRIKVADKSLETIGSKILF